MVRTQCFKNCLSGEPEDASGSGKLSSGVGVSGGGSGRQAGGEWTGVWLMMARIVPGGRGERERSQQTKQTLN